VAHHFSGTDTPATRVPGMFLVGAHSTPLICHLERGFRRSKLS
jgi:hypothetical protein